MQQSPIELTVLCPKRFDLNWILFFILFKYTALQFLASLWLAGQIVVIPLLKWPFIQERDAEKFQISYDKC